MYKSDFTWTDVELYHKYTSKRRKLFLNYFRLNHEDYVQKNHSVWWRSVSDFNSVRTIRALWHRGIITYQTLETHTHGYSFFRTDKTVHSFIRKLRNVQKGIRLWNQIELKMSLFQTSKEKKKKLQKKIMKPVDGDIEK